ncbi:anthranilate synthase component II [Agaribacter marinus]|uniref:Glutamine amidotransferase n=1 Tax=Agaribacter marinus TaxID=1431249 RepID=A0AA37WJJ1_9ALTE|nr:aminodeoxychorismate/anthranilate synthase component II [Agaribacter marinus]GLR72303.1 glutamine amidotransferase [Agaribacter marinus]
MIIIIDNYDSFTYNLVRYFEELGQQVEVYKNDRISVDALINMTFDHLVISPGPCSPNESGMTLPIIEAFWGHKPILGVCLGHQAIAQHAGANIVTAKVVRHGKISTIKNAEGSLLFKECRSTFSATRYHSLLIDPNTLPNTFRVTAWCDDFGDKEIMAIEDKINRVYGVQFHPESLLTEFGHEILNNFILFG